jgi:glycine cleavage system aminomethyltransferase T
MAYLAAERAAPGTGFQVDVRGRLRDAVVKEKPLYRKD